MKKPIKDMAASLRDRLKQIADRQGIEFQQILNRYVIERVLYRLSKSDYSNEFILKGATLFTLWEGLPHRRTRDLDLLGFGENSADRLQKVFQHILDDSSSDDGLIFGKLIVAPIREDQEYGGLRVNTEANLGRTMIALSIDIGFGDDVVPSPIFEDFPSLLNQPKPHIRVYPVETVVAEKLEAMITLGMANSRMKDFFDIWHLSKHRTFDGARLSMAVEATLRRRKTSIPKEDPLALTPIFANDPSKLVQWTAFCRRNISAGELTEFPFVIDQLRELLMPVLRSIQSQTAFSKLWVAGGPWQLGGFDNA